MRKGIQLHSMNILSINQSLRAEASRVNLFKFGLLSATLYNIKDSSAYNAMCVKAHRGANELTIYNEETWYCNRQSRDIGQLIRE